MEVKVNIRMDMISISSDIITSSKVTITITRILSRDSKVKGHDTVTLSQHSIVRIEATASDTEWMGILKTLLSRKGTMKDMVILTVTNVSSITKIDFEQL